MKATRVEQETTQVLGRWAAAVIALSVIGAIASTLARAPLVTSTFAAFLTVVFTALVLVAMAVGLLIAAAHPPLPPLESRSILFQAVGRIGGVTTFMAGMLFSAAVAWQIAFALETEVLLESERLRSVVQLLLFGLLGAVIAVSARMGVHLTRVERARRRLMLHLALRRLGVRRAHSRARIVAAASWAINAAWVLPVASLLGPIVLMGIWNAAAATIPS